MTQPTANRRFALTMMGGGVASLALVSCGRSVEAKNFPVSRSEAEWRKRLTAAEFRVLREEGTERAYSSPLDKEKRAGTYACAGCGNAVYSSEHKYDSGTGWPSFWRPIKASAVGTSRDLKLGYPRKEVHCARCGGHLGHIFNDGPQPTGKRHCLNGVALDFRPA
ncbi:peptide-methionine (R)-S-oxide reductase MsrB [Citromicrobium bathyomarinum]|uniref:peptide-methionine (R)-S-oxide reductase MsrB n=1 Tax=Citromicrobium bathyomarinum TaxID=72174 RepID=UPI00315A8F2A